MDKSYYLFLANIAVESGGVALCIVSGLLIFLSKRIYKQNVGSLQGMNFSIGGGLISNIVGLIFKGNSNPIIFNLVKTANFLEFFFSYSTLFFFGYYLLFKAEKTGRKSKKNIKILLILIYAVQILLLIISQFKNLYYYYDENLAYQRGEYFWISHFVCIASMIINAIIFVSNHKLFSNRENTGFFTYILFPTIALILQTFIYGLFLTNFAEIFGLGIMMFFLLYDQMEMYIKREQEYSKMKIDIMLSQIQPHFIFNSISAIYELCRQDSEKARSALLSFSNYLRGNMNSLNSPELIPFNDELNHINAYLELEKMRFNDRLNIVYDIKEKDFMIPPLSVQPIVENAVKHGLCKKENGGTLILTTEKNDNNILITVSDNGVGFDTELLNNTSNSHIGLNNVTKRLQQSGKGDLIIQSKPNEGTTVIITIFEQEQKI